jgi:hypothetical protein
MVLGRRSLSPCAPAGQEILRFALDDRIYPPASTETARRERRQESGKIRATLKVVDPSNQRNQAMSAERDSF